LESVTYDVQIGRITRTLRKTKLKEGVYVPSFVMLGDTRLIEEAADLLAEKLSAYVFDIMVGPEAKVIPLLHALAVRLGQERYVVCRKSVKAYMRDVLSVEVQSITTVGHQVLVLNGLDAERIKGKRVCVIDDVVSTGGSMRSVEQLVSMAGGTVTCRATVMKEGEWFKDPLVYVGYLPVWTS
jgi:adenine phosphoribosyltransferase